MVLLFQPPPTPTVSLPEGGTDRGLVLRRTWVIAPHHRPSRSPTAILTGLFGFPWPAASLEAKCAAGHHHRVVPDPHCTCGIYACGDGSAIPGDGVLPIGRPVAHGFVALDGAAVTVDGVTRAQRATVVGPLVIGAGRPSLTVRTAHRLGAATRPATVVDEVAGYRVTWGGGTVGVAYAEWRAWAAAHLSDRYGVSVE